jgi:hypothetical protein
MTQTARALTPRETLEAAIAKHNLDITTEFVPFSRSRHAGEKLPQLNWRVTLHDTKAKRAILTTDYSAGMAYAPSYTGNAFQGMTGRDMELVHHECEHGRPAAYTNGSVYSVGKKKIEPITADVIYSLVSDASVLDYSTFENWADDMGYDPDSRKGEGIYRLCLSHALALRNAIGEAGLAELREASQDY